jgi:hypothetical protein
MLQRSIAVIVALVLSMSVATGAAGQVAGSFVEMFSGTPPAPEAYSNPHNWDIFVQGFEANHYTGQAAQVGQHGPDCGPPGFPYTAANTHPLTDESSAVYICNNHVMTTTGLAGYAAIYMTPPAVADFSSGEATVSWEMSTLRTGSRDWPDVVLTPFSEHSEMAYNNNDQHIPPHNIHVQLAGGGNVWLVTQRIGGGVNYNEGHDATIAGNSTTWDDVFHQFGLNESAQRRDVMELKVSRTHISMCMPKYQLSGGQVFCWVNASLAEPLDDSVWHGQASVMLAHRSYNVEKSCSSDEDEFAIVHNAYGDANCPPNTWHWGNVVIQPAVPYGIVPSTSGDVTRASGGRVDFPAPAGDNAFLSFVSFGHTPSLPVSFVNGVTWAAPRLQPAVAPSEENGEAIFTPMPAGVSSVMVRGANGGWGSFQATNFAIYTPPGGGQIVTPVATATLVATATATSAATATATRVPTTATVAPTTTPTPAPGVTCAVSVAINGTPGTYKPC